MSLEITDTRDFQALMDGLPDVQTNGTDALFINTANRSREQFIDGLRKALGLFADLDGTLHTGTQWDDIRKLMTNEGRRDEQEDLDRFFASGAVRTPQDDFGLIFRSVIRLAAANVTRDALTECARRSKPRAGVQDLLNTFRGQTAIASFGLFDYIVSWVYCHTSLPIPDIFALRLTWTLTGKMVNGFEAHTAITGQNKGFTRDIFCAAHRLPSSRVLVLGDSPLDALTMDQETLGVLIVPHVDSEARCAKFRREGLKELWPRVGAVLASDSLLPLHELRSSP